ncbi:response regulator transcription factor [Nocardia donostiensis]|uniref:DNA-binding response regulator n=1 Tax=Nocardia donostiensis TaxID=1538463 RepID=A0A1W0B1C0_9NOCA|nr:response regulator transcription factor [Nocardia donostiensis]ONM46391.1 DNA-binding response regulator [Nocardia donostiensis]OQS16319.1 DNA-binding response regulator [Nocardia donostiensis]OQS18302.1 DNA-binding response regulator [Nocardia donostiensis]
MIQVLIVDDEHLVCEYLQLILQSASDITVSGAAHNGADAIKAIGRLAPDVVLMDLRMPEMDGLTAIEHLMSGPEPPRIIALTTFDTDGHVIRAMKAGAAGFVLKSTPPRDLIGMIRVVADGHTVLSDDVVSHLLPRETPEIKHTRNTLDTLSDRELKVLSLLGRGASNRQIAETLYLSEATIKGHVSQILRKLQCQNRSQAGILVRSMGML